MKRPEYSEEDDRGYRTIRPAVALQAFADDMEGYADFLEARVKDYKELAHALMGHFCKLNADVCFGTYDSEWANKAYKEEQAKMEALVGVKKKGPL